MTDQNQSCAACGLLYLLDPKTGDREEAPPVFRKEGRKPAGYERFDSYPRCHVHSPKLPDFPARHRHIQQIKPAMVDTIAAAINEPTDCRGFLRWKPGSLPSEHIKARDREKEIAKDAAEKRCRLVLEIILRVGASAVLGIVSWLASNLLSRTLPSVVVGIVASVVTYFVIPILAGRPGSPPSPSEP